MSDKVLKIQNMRRDQSSLARFAFGGAAGQVLRDYFNRDVQQARLSTKFKAYYRLRPIIPIPLRQLLQRGRNRGFDAPADWYLPTEFVKDFREAIDSEPNAVAIHPWPDGYQMSAVLTHDVETKAGLALINELATIEEQHGFRSAWNIIPYDYEVDLGLIADLKDRGHEIGVHGYNHDGRLFESHRTFKRRTKPINQAIANFGSEGFRAPMVHRNLQWMEALDIDHDSSCFDIDPFQAMPGGVGGPWPFFAGKFVELPYTLPQDHTLLISLGETTPEIWIKKLAHLRSLAGMALLITHPDYLDTPARLDVYRQFLEHLSEQQEVWHALPREIASWWRQRENLEIVGDSGSLELIGPAAKRTRIFSVSDLAAR
jgi:peptidoglycan/xylan/chitin deacetylase (PgdA/CDA1 family)